jgi:hypothetical protein
MILNKENTIRIDRSGTSYTVTINGSALPPQTIADPVVCLYIGDNALSLPKGLIYDVNLNNEATYAGNELVTWTDTSGNGNNGTVAGSPAPYTGQGFDGYVSTWYDQSGNANNATQATTTAQPKIVDAGALVTGGLDFDGVDDQLDLTGSALDIFRNVGYGQVFSVATSDETGLSTANIFGAKTGGSPSRFLVSESNVTAGSFRIGGRRLDGDAFDATTASAAHGNAEKLVTGFLNWADAEAYIYQDGVNVGTDLSFQTAGNTADTSSSSAAISEGNFDGRIGELIIYNTDQSANRVGIETNINDYYSIYA